MVNQQIERRQWYSVKAEAGKPAEIRLYDIIDPIFGVGADEFVRALQDVTADAIELHINSRGGDVFEGITILNALRDHPARITTIVDGVAASIASTIAMAGDEIVMNRGSQMMVHNPWSLCVGNAQDMQKQADFLVKQANNMAQIYADRAGGTVEGWLSIMAEETWMLADEAVEAGLADRVVEQPEKGEAKLAAAVHVPGYALAAFKYADRQVAPAPRIAAALSQTPRPKEDEAERREPTVALSEIALQKLGLDAEADEDAINEAIEKFAEPDEQGTPAEPTIEQAAQVAAKFGQKLVNVASYDQMAATVADLQARNEAAIQAENETAITNALTSGRIDAASADTWRAELGKNREGTLSLLATLPANKAVPVDEVGHGVSREDSAQDAEMATVAARITGKTFGKDA